MKRYIVYLVALSAVLAAVSCVKEKDIPLALDTDVIEIGPEGGVRALEISVSEDWVAMTNEPWIAFSPANGRGGERCNVIIDSTLSYGKRDDVVRIRTASGDYKDITIVQSGSHARSQNWYLTEVRDRVMSH